jgi:hypothetical protein
MKHSDNCLLLLAVVTSALIFSSVASAQTTTTAQSLGSSVWTGANVGNTVTPTQQSTNSYITSGPAFGSSNPYTPSLTTSSTLSSADGSATATATATPGALHAYASADSYADNVLNTSAFATAVFDDSLDVESSTLAVGTVVTLQFSISLDYTLTPTGGGTGTLNTAPTGADTVQAQFTEVDAANAANVGSEFDAQGLVPPALVAADGPNILTGIMTVDVGDTVNVQELLGVLVGANGIGGVATADANDTANFYADSLTAGVNLVSASGFDYSSPVPDSGPGLAATAATLLGLCVLSRGFARRRISSR